MRGGPSIRFGDSVNTDVIIPGRYLVSIDPAELAEHAFEPLGPSVQAAVRSSKVIVAGKNFGCGSAREQAASCLVGAGIEVVLARSFARVFYRNAINTGLPAIALGDAVEAIEEGAEVWVDLEAGEVRAGDASVPFPPFPASLRRILDAGGLIPYLARHVVGGAAS
ncbi:MAG: 3-isopropylmalate dehydratase [Actinomycetota bacterium]|jgi:3-isopropylmalate/(R)-2-methylmalate dehydratase small subunit|nr:3-isopropylmalate dehydratase [Actinomycetota bacterium]